MNTNYRCGGGRVGCASFFIIPLSISSARPGWTAVSRRNELPQNKRIRLQRIRSRVNDMISATQRMAYTRRSNGQAFKPGSQDPVATPLCGVSALAAGG